MTTKKINSKNVKIIAHRGLSGLETENTRGAFIAAGNRSYFGIETDVHVTDDNHFAIIHDDTTSRVSGGYDLNVEKSPLSLLQSIPLIDTLTGDIRQDIRIPELKDYINICKRYDKICVLELKNHMQKEDLRSIISVFENLSYLENCIFISFDMQNCINMRNLAKYNKIQFLANLNDYQSKIGELIKILTYNKLDIDAYHKSLTKELIEKFHQNRIKVNCWTVDNEDEALQLIEHGVDYITTNIIE